MTGLEKLVEWLEGAIKARNRPEWPCALEIRDKARSLLAEEQGRKEVVLVDGVIETWETDPAI